VKVLNDEVGLDSAQDIVEEGIGPASPPKPPKKEPPRRETPPVQEHGWDEDMSRLEEEL